MDDVRLSEIWIYPVKSMGGIQLQEAKVMEKGLQHDRRWMLVDEQGVFMTQRVFPLMALFKLKMENQPADQAGEKFMIQFGNDSRKLPDTATGDLMQTRVWNDTVRVREGDPESSHWFSHHLKVKCKLVSFPEDENRLVEENYRVNNENVSLADAYPFLIIGQRSLDALNPRMQKPLPMNRFRPNFVFTGGEAHEEDTWRDFTIGKNRFTGVKPCSRCVLTSVDQDTAQKGDEPLRTLATYRKQGNKIYFGQNLLAVDHLEVKVGDVITVQTKAS